MSYANAGEKFLADATDIHIVIKNDLAFAKTDARPPQTIVQAPINMIKIFQIYMLSAKSSFINRY